MSFAINFLDITVPKDSLQPGERAISGEIRIGDFRERLKLPVNYWAKSKYIRQWIEGVERLIVGSEDTVSILVTQAYDPAAPMCDYLLECWPLYRKGDTVYIQNYYEPVGALKHPLRLQELYASISPQKDDVSEWTISTHELQEWLMHLKKLPN